MIERGKGTTIRDRIVGLERVRAGDLVAHPANWRTHPKAQIEALQESLGELGYADALVARRLEDGRLQLIDGHARSELDPDQMVPVLVTDLQPDEAEKLLLVKDPIAGMAVANKQALADLMARTQVASEALRERLQAQVGMLAAKPRLDEVPPLPEDPVTAQGDLWVLGPHRLLCGDAEDPVAVARLLNGAKPTLMVTDPPYGVDYDPAWRSRAAEKGQLAYAPTRVGVVQNDDRFDWEKAWSLSPAAVVYAWAPAGSAFADHQRALERAGFEVRMTIIWVKSHLPIGRGHYHVRHEPCLYAVRKGATAHWIGDRKQNTVWEATLDHNVPGGHSTQKPVEVMAHAIRNHGGDVYDPFVGSGTTLIAAQECGRVCWAMDLDPAYCDVVVRRWEKLTGQQATKVDA